MSIEIKYCRYGRMMYYTTDLYIGGSLQNYGEYSQGELELFGQLLRQPEAQQFVALDIGANIGTHTLFLAQKVGRVYAIEPQRQIYRMLVGNLAFSEIRNAEPILGGIGATNGSMTMPIIDHFFQSNFGAVGPDTPIKNPGLNPDGVSTYLDTVPMMTIDSMNFDRLDFIKLDAEGMEYDAIQGGLTTIERCLPMLYIEYNETATPKLLPLLFDRGYKFFWHTTYTYNPDNYFKNPTNIFGMNASNNMLGFPNLPIYEGVDGEPINTPHDRNPKFTDAKQVSDAAGVAERLSTA